MSKAEERALEAFPSKIEGDSRGSYDLNELNRQKFLLGYHQAEKDLELTIEDIEKVHTFLYAVKNNKQGAFTFTRLSDEKYQEVLKRFQDYKERVEDDI